MTTTTAPTITLDDVLRALMETRNTIEANAEAVRLRFEQEARLRAEEAKEEARLRAEEHRIYVEREEARRIEEAKEEAKKRAEEARLRAEREAEAKASRMDFDKRMKELSKQMGGHANRLGEFVQEMVKPAAVRLFQERNLPVHQVISNHKVLDDNRQFVMEIDLIVINTDIMIALECKSKLTQEDVDEHLDRLEKIKPHIPQYRNYTVLGGVAAMVIPETVSRYAHRNGLYVLSQSGDAVEIRNPSGFDAKEW